MNVFYFFYFSNFFCVFFFFVKSSSLIIFKKHHVTVSPIRQANEVSEKGKNVGQTNNHAAPAGELFEGPILLLNLGAALHFSNYVHFALVLDSLLELCHYFCKKSPISKIVHTSNIYIPLPECKTSYPITRQ